MAIGFSYFNTMKFEELIRKEGKSSIQDNAPLSPLAGMMHQLLGSAFKLHAGIGFLRAKLPLRH